MELHNRVHQLADQFLPEITGIRRHLHAHPELSFKEFETSRYITDRLRHMGIEFEDGIVNTGIVATIKGRNPEKRTIALRADIDALPIIEENEVDYRSKNQGVMHACGHDVHTSSLLGAIRILNDLRDEFEGTIRCIFQPGEEVLPGGASLMIKEGVLENPTPSTIYGQHVYPDLEAGKVGFKSGMYMASSDEIEVTVYGKGGHGALPHFNVDPVLITSHLIVALQQIVSRNSRPDLPTVLSFGRVEANGVYNIIPDKVTLQGTFRTFNEAWRLDAHKKMVNLATKLAESMGGLCDFDIRKGYPFLVNDEKTADQAKERAIEFLGRDRVIDLDLRMTAEDFAYYTQMVPACFYRLGVRNESAGITSGLHTSTFDVDESSLGTGMGLMAWLALRELGAG